MMAWVLMLQLQLLIRLREGCHPNLASSVSASGCSRSAARSICNQPPARVLRRGWRCRSTRGARRFSGGHNAEHRTANLYHHPEDPNQIRVLFFDDHAMMRQRAICEIYPDIKVFGEACGG